VRLPGRGIDLEATVVYSPIMSYSSTVAIGNCSLCERQQANLTPTVDNAVDSSFETQNRANVAAERERHAAAVGRIGEYRGVPSRDRQTNHLATERRNARQPPLSPEPNNLGTRVIRQENDTNRTVRDFEDFAITPLRVNGTTDLDPVPLPPGLFESTAHWKPVPAIPRRSLKRKWGHFMRKAPGHLNVVDEEQMADPTEGLSANEKQVADPREGLLVDEQQVADRIVEPLTGEEQVVDPTEGLSGVREPGASATDRPTEEEKHVENMKEPKPLGWGGYASLDCTMKMH